MAPGGPGHEAEPKGKFGLDVELMQMHSRATLLVVSILTAMGLSACSDGAYVIGGYLDSWCKRFGCGWRQSHVTELDNVSGWVQVRVDDSGQEGWIEDRFIIWN